MKKYIIATLFMCTSLLADGFFDELKKLKNNIEKNTQAKQVEKNTEDNTDVFDDSITRGYRAKENRREVLKRFCKENIYDIANTENRESLSRLNVALQNASNTYPIYKQKFIELGAREDDTPDNCPNISDISAYKKSIESIINDISVDTDTKTVYEKWKKSIPGFRKNVKAGDYFWTIWRKEMVRGLIVETKYPLIKTRIESNHFGVSMEFFKAEEIYPLFPKECMRGKGLAAENVCYIKHYLNDVLYGK
jgi:hypothetical protein